MAAPRKSLTPEDVARHLNEGRTQTWIAQAYDIGHSAVTYRKREAIAMGLWSDRDKVTIGKMAVGRLNQSLARQSPEVQRWIIKTTEAMGDATIADFVVACAVDAYWDVKENTK